MDKAIWKFNIPCEYVTLLDDIKERIRLAEYEALGTVNKELISLYLDIGRMIVDRQEGMTWGKSVVEQLAKDLQAEFSGISGFSARNIWYMRDFYNRGAEAENLSLRELYRMNCINLDNRS